MDTKASDLYGIKALEVAFKEALEDAREAELMMTDCSDRQGVGKPKEVGGDSVICQIQDYIEFKYRYRCIPMSFGGVLSASTASHMTFDRNR